VANLVADAVQKITVTPEAASNGSGILHLAYSFLRRYSLSVVSTSPEREPL
jgi:hypothetical protein